MAAAVCISVTAHAEGWNPERAIEIVAGSGAGGAQDRTARAMQRIWKEEGIIAVATSVVNKPGGGGAVSLAYLNQRAADGHYIAVGSPTLLINHIAGTGKLNYTDMTPLALLFSEYIVLAVREDSPIRTGEDLVRRLKTDPSSISAAVATARGGMQHVTVGLVAKAAGADPRKLRVVVFDSGGESITAAMGGHVDVVATAAANAAQQMRNGRLRVIGVAAPRRLEGVYANVPTWSEQGYEVVASNWRSVLGLRGMTPAQVAWWDSVLGKLVQTPEWNEDIRKNEWANNYLNSADTRVFLAAQYESLRSILAELLAR